MKSILHHIEESGAGTYILTSSIMALFSDSSYTLFETLTIKGRFQFGLKLKPSMDIFIGEYYLEIASIIYLDEGIVSVHKGH
jgi:hypothetical protein